MNSDSSKQMLSRALHPLVILVAVVLFGSGCSEKSAPDQELPAILRNAQAGSGWDSACPPANKTEQSTIKSSGLAVSPEFDQRLREQFPPGSSASTLSTFLTTQRFESWAPCATDATIQRATFFKKGKGLLPYDVHASVFWKVDSDSKIVWTKGFVAYSGL